MAIIGPGSVVQNEISPDPKLKGLDSSYIVTVWNPLTDDFAIQVGVSKPVDVPIQVSDPATKGQTKLSESDLTRTYGVGLKNTDHDSRRHFTNQAVIPAGKSMRFTGDVAQVAVSQIVNEVIQREGDGKLLADAFARRNIEDRIVLSIQSQTDFMNTPIQTVNQQVQDAVNRSNEGINDDEAFPGLDTGAGEVGSLEEPADPGEKVDRRRKATS